MTRQEIQRLHKLSGGVRRLRPEPMQRRMEILAIFEREGTPLTLEYLTEEIPEQTYAQIGRTTRQMKLEGSLETSMVSK